MSTCTRNFLDKKAWSTLCEFFFKKHFKDLLRRELIPKCQSDVVAFIKDGRQISINKITLKAEKQLTTNQCEFVNDLKHTDLISGVYEGGFKLWECSIDLVQYLIDEKVNLDGKHVLEVMSHFNNAL